MVLWEEECGGHYYPCCSEACGIRLGKRLENGMITPEQIYEKTGQVEYSQMIFDTDNDEERISNLRIRIKQLENLAKKCS